MATRGESLKDLAVVAGRRQSIMRRRCEYNKGSIEKDKILVAISPDKLLLLLSANDYLEPIRVLGPRLVIFYGASGSLYC
jgi:hypothetical protein